MVNNRILKLEKNYPDSVNGSNESLPLDTVKTVDLPLDVILRDNVALSYFIDYVCSHGKQAYIYLYFNIDGKFKRTPYLIIKSVLFTVFKVGKHL